MGLGCNISDSCRKHITGLYLDIFTTSLHLLICMFSRRCIVCPSHVFLCRLKFGTELKHFLIDVLGGILSSCHRGLELESVRMKLSVLCFVTVGSMVQTLTTKLGHSSVFFFLFSCIYIHA